MSTLLCYIYYSGDYMTIVELIEGFKNREHKRFNNFLNEVANYVMYEQAMIKKDNKSHFSSSIKYRFDERSFNYINDFISSITFLSKPVIGKGKKVIIKDMPEEYLFEPKHELSFSDKIYILDKIKDVFMHTRLDETMYDFDFSDGYIVLRNVADDYSLECKIPFVALYKFNRYVMEDFDKSSPSIMWANKFLKNYELNGPPKNIKFARFSSNKQVFSAGSFNKVVIKGENGDISFHQHKPLSNASLSFNCRMSRESVEAYHTPSYVASIVSSKSDANYPLLDHLYDFEISCSNNELKNKVNAIFEKIEAFYKHVYENGEHIQYGKLKDNVKDLIYTNNGQNNEEKGLLVDISFVHNAIIKRFIRNARSHANLKEKDGTAFGNAVVSYHDVSYNSYLNGDSEKSIPSFTMVGNKHDFDYLFLEVIDKSKSNAEVFEQMTSQYDVGSEDAFEPFFKQLEDFINFAFKMYADDYEITNNSYLNTPVGNASNFVDFLRKIINGTFEYESGQRIGRR